MRDIAIPCPSPNFKPKAVGERKITCIVIHATATSGISSPREWLCNPASRVSAHYLIGKDGVILQLVEEKDVSWHAGESEWKGQEFVNGFSIGIELVNANDAKDPYPQEQLDVCVKLVAAICKDYGIACCDVVGHRDIAPGRKTDPARFPFDEFRMRLADLGIPDGMVKQ